MPNPKTGTVTVDVATAVKEVKAGKVEFRVDKTGVIHVPVGKVSFASDKLVENANTAVAGGGEGQARGRQRQIRAERDHLLHHGAGRSAGCDAVQPEGCSEGISRRIQMKKKPEKKKIWRRLRAS
jgi:hypothetical protein